MISVRGRQHAVQLVQHARSRGARLAYAYAVPGVILRAPHCWTHDSEMREEQRTFAERPVPRHDLAAAERENILNICHRRGFADLPPDQFVVRFLGGEQRFLASVSSFYRVLHRHGNIVRRGRAKKPRRTSVPATYWTTEFKGATLLEKLRELNMGSSFSRPRVSNDNAFSEALFRTCKHAPNYSVNGFTQQREAYMWAQGFVCWYSRTHRHRGIRFVILRSATSASTPQSCAAARRFIKRRATTTRHAGAAQPVTGRGPNRLAQSHAGIQSHASKTQGPGGLTILRHDRYLGRLPGLYPWPG